MIGTDEAVIACRYHAELAAEIESLTSRILSRAKAGRTSGLEDDVRYRRLQLERFNRLAHRLKIVVRKSRRSSNRVSAPVPSSQLAFERRHASVLENVRDQDRQSRICLERIRATVQQKRLAVMLRRKTAGLYGPHSRNNPQYVSMTT